MSLSGSNTRSDTAGSPLRLVNKWESPSRSSTDTAGLSAGAAILQKTDLPQGPEPSHLWPLHGKVPSSSPQGVQFSSMTESPNPEHSRPLPTTATWHSLCLCPPLDVHRTSSLSPFMLQTKCLPLHCSLWASCTQQSFLSAPCFICCITFSTGLPRWLSGKESTCQRRRHRFSPWVGKIPREENSNSLQYSCLENSKKRGPGQVTVHGITKRHDWVMRATFSISEYGFFFFFFFGFPDSAGSFLRAETFSVLYLLHSSDLEKCLTRSQASTKSYGMKQWSWDSTLVCQMQRPSTEPTHSISSPSCSYPASWCDDAQNKLLLSAGNLSGVCKQLSGPIFLFSLQCLTLLSCISYREVSRPASMSLCDLPLPEGPTSPMAQGLDWSRRWGGRRSDLPMGISVSTLTLQFY